MRYLATWLSSMLWTFLCCHYLWTLRSQSQSDTDIFSPTHAAENLCMIQWFGLPLYGFSVDSFLSSFSITEILLLKFLGMSGTSHVTIILVFFILPKHFHTVSSRSVDHLSSALSVLSALFLETHSFQHSFWVVTMWYIAIIIATVMVLSLLRLIFHLHPHWLRNIHGIVRTHFHVLWCVHWTIKWDNS